jgi:hypothetical protein
MMIKSKAELLREFSDTALELGDAEDRASADEAVEHQACVVSELRELYGVTDAELDAYMEELNERELLDFINRQANEY